MPSIQIQIRGESFGADLPNAPVQIGAAESADLRINGDGIAAVHCILEPLTGGLHVLRDAKSGQPTTVNGIAVRQVSLRDGDLIQVGEARIQYRAGSFAAPPSPAAPATAPAPAAASVETLSYEEEAPVAEAPALQAPQPKAEPETRRGPTEVAATSEAHARPRQAKRKGAFGAIAGLLVAAVVLGVVIWAVSGSGGGDATPTRRTYADGMRAYEAKDYAKARRLWEQVIAVEGATRVRRDAEIGLQLIGDVELEMEAKLEQLWTERLDLTSEALDALRASFVKSHGEREAARFDSALTRVRAAQASWKRDELERVRARVAGCLGSNDFVGARAVWGRTGRSAPAAIRFDAEVEAGIAALETSADEAADKLLAQSRTWIEARQAYRSVKLLENALRRFAGMRAQARLEVGLEAARTAAAVVSPTPGPSAPVEPGTPQPTQPVKPDEVKALEVAARAAVKQAAERVDARRFGDAALILTAAYEPLPPGALRTDLQGRAEDLRLAEQGLTLLIAHINASTRSYASVKLNDRLRVSLAGADRDTLAALVTGGRTKYRWERISQSAFPRLADRMRPKKDAALPVAALLHAVGATEPSERLLYQAGELGVPTDVLFAVLARWRGEDVPADGYVVHDARYVTPEQRDFLVREARIEDALTRVGHREAQERAAAYDVLLEIGEPARARFQRALTNRRKYLVEELVDSRSFTGSKYKAKLLKLLAERRRHALVLIYDARAYPYPNPNKQNQAEVEDRVDKVREVWERPFDLVAQWDKKLGEGLAGVTEVDEVLSKVDEAYQPDLDEIKSRINKVIDVPSAADVSLREYSLKVLGYNETLTTTATHEEKDNTRVVNAYRMMMGLAAVKINERLLRAARGHSRHMSKNGYFAHNVPAPYATPENRTPGARAKRQGFGGGVGENIARGPSTGRGAFNAWFGSSGHHRNMLGRGWLQMGCGRADGTWWTQLFASGSKSLKAPDPLPDPEPAVAPDPEGKTPRTPERPPELPDEAPPGEPAPPDFPDDLPPPPPGDEDPPPRDDG